MRTINAAALAKIASQYGSEPIIILEIFWNGVDGLLYADRDVSYIPGRIITIDGLDDIINVSNSSSSQSVQITLDDTDGSIKDLFNHYNFHLKSAKIYQYFEELALTDKFLLFDGKLNTPITWNEGDRTVSCTITSQIEDIEIGFSAEEGQFEDLPASLIGQAWPMCFGTTIQSKALQLSDRYSGVLAEGVGFADEYLLKRAAACGVIGNYISYAFTAIEQNSHIQQAIELNYTYNQQKATEKDSIYVFGGEDFPRGSITLLINDKEIYGHFVNNVFHISGHEDFCEGKTEPRADGYTVINNWNGEAIFIPTGQIIGDNCGYVYLSPGSAVKLSTYEPQRYVVSIVPGTVLKVTAISTKNGKQFLLDVPTDLYTVTTETFGDISAVILTTQDALSKYDNMDWGDDLYVTFQSSIGPNTVDIIRYLIETYSDHDIDEVSFAAVKARVENYPSDFTIYDRPNLLTILQQIAWQARCSIYLKNSTFYLQYLPETPTSCATLTRNDIISNTVEISYTNTEELVTKMVCNWRASGMQENDNKLILRNNIGLYGTHSQDYDFNIYNFVDAVLKSASYWMRHYSNTWKKIKFQTPLHLLYLESLDAITIDYPGLIADSSVLCKIEKAEYNSDNRTIDFEVWCPVRAGSMSQYDFAYPADLDVSYYYPSAEEYADQEDYEYMWEEAVEIAEWQGNSGGGMSIVGCSEYPRDEEDPYQNTETENSEYSKDELADIDRRVSSRGAIKVTDVGDKPPGQPKLPNTPQLEAAAPGPDSSSPGHPLLQQDSAESSAGTEPSEDETGTGTGSNNANSTDPMDQLPEPEETSEEDYPCKAEVCLSWISASAVKVGGPTGPLSTVDGASGYPVAGELIHCFEKYVFATLTEAEDYVDSLNSFLPATSSVGGTPTPYAAGVVPGGSDGCETNDGNPIAYHRNAGDTSSDTMMRNA